MVIHIFTVKNFNNIIGDNKNDWHHLYTELWDYRINHLDKMIFYRNIVFYATKNKS